MTRTFVGLGFRMLAAAFVSQGCGGDVSAVDASSAADGGMRRDSGAVDAGRSDAGRVDAGAQTLDAGPMDGGAGDAGSADAGASDGGCVAWTASAFRLDFDDAPDGTLVGMRYASSGALLSRPGGEPVAFRFFESPASPPGYVMGEYEGTDLNPSTEFGNNEPALPITITFVNPTDSTFPGVTTRVSLQAIFTNDGNVTRLEAYDATGVMVAADQVTGRTGEFAQSLTVSAAAIHEVTVVFNAPGSTGAFEDSAGIDDLDVAALMSVCR